MKHRQQSRITFIEKDGILYQDLTLPKQKEIGRFGRQHLAFLKEHCKGTYTTLLTTGKLNEHLAEIDREATELYHSLISKLAKSEGITEQLKAADPLGWAQAMNNIAQRASEIAQKELLFN